MNLIDIGVNFHASQLKSVGPELLTRAADAGVTHILATGTSLSSSNAALDFARRHPRVWATAGVHPHTAKEYTAATGEALAALWTEERIVAVGECGLDYNRMFSPAEQQRSAFEAQIQASLTTAKPLFLHCRDAFEDFHAMLREATRAGAHGVVHCFTDGAAQAEAFLALGLDLGITGWVTDLTRGTALRDALRVIPIDRLHLETDAPYLRPRNAGKTRPYNEPALLPFVAQAVAELKGIDVAALAAQASANSRRLFGLPD
ncbi:MAG TPA: TatD family hydrolase [Burkholderiales bacterium]|nr:TatD family hydrolase [Burkholderiales bacterium]